MVIILPAASSRRQSPGHKHKSYALAKHPPAAGHPQNLDAARPAAECRAPSLTPPHIPCRPRPLHRCAQLLRRARERPLARDIYYDTAIQKLSSARTHCREDKNSSEGVLRHYPQHLAPANLPLAGRSRAWGAQHAAHVIRRQCALHAARGAGTELSHWQPRARPDDGLTQRRGAAHAALTRSRPAPPFPRARCGSSACHSCSRGPAPWSTRSEGRGRPRARASSPPSAARLPPQPPCGGADGP